MERPKLPGELGQFHRADGGGEHGRHDGPARLAFAVDRDLAKRGETIFARATAAGGCAECHGIAPGEKRPDAAPTWKTRVIDVGTDRQAWTVALREVEVGSMEGAAIQNLVQPLRARDKALFLLRAGVVGAIAQVRNIGPKMQAEDKKTDNPKTRVKEIAVDRAGLTALRATTALQSSVGFGPPPPLVVNGYEARVLQGIWAGAPTSATARCRA